MYVNAYTMILHDAFHDCTYVLDAYRTMIVLNPTMIGENPTMIVQNPTMILP